MQNQTNRKCKTKSFIQPHPHGTQRTVSRFAANGNLRLYSYDRLFYSLYGYDGGTTRTYKYSFDLNPNWVNGRLESVNFNMHNAMFYPNSYLNFNQDGYYTKHYYNGMERIASRLGNQALSISTHDPELQDRKDQLDSNIRRNIVGITGYNFLPVGEEQNPDDPMPVFEMPQVGMTGLQPIGSGSVYYYHSNHLGSTCYVTDGNASVVQGFLYAPFGEITNEYNVGWQNGVLPKYSFNAKELDEETGMYYYEARYYAPPTFISRDVLFEEKPWFTPYHYCSNNPVVRVDPSGMLDDWWEDKNGVMHYTTEYTSSESFNKSGIDGKYRGKTYQKGGNYYSLFGQKLDANSKFGKLTKKIDDAFIKYAAYCNADMPKSYCLFDAEWHEPIQESTDFSGIEKFNSGIAVTFDNVYDYKGYYQTSNVRLNVSEKNMEGKVEAFPKVNQIDPIRIGGPGAGKMAITGFHIFIGNPVKKDVVTLTFPTRDALEKFKKRCEKILGIKL